MNSTIFYKLKIFTVLYFFTAVTALSQKEEPQKDEWNYTFTNSGETDQDSIQLDIISPVTDFQIQYKNGDTLLWQMVSNNAGSIYLARRGVDSLIISSNRYPTTRFAFNDYPLKVLEINYKKKSGLDKFNSDASSTLTEDFRNDPTGCAGLREKHLTFGEKDILFDNQSIIGLTKNELIALLGEPNEIDGKAKRMKRYKTSGRQSFRYFISICGEQKTGYSIGITFKDNQVESTIMRMHCG
jgi:hypothetical protein